MTTQTQYASINQLGTVLVTGGAGFLGTNLTRTLLEFGLKVRVFDLAASTVEHPNLEKVRGDICDPTTVQAACKGITTIFHTAALIETRGGRGCSEELRQKVFAVNVEGTRQLFELGRAQGVKRFVYTASNSVVIGGQPLRHASEDVPYTNRFADLYTETKVVAEKWVLGESGKGGLMSCSIRPSGIWGPGDKTMFAKFIEEMIHGRASFIIGDGESKLDNSYVANLVHGQILAALQLGESGAASGQAYFINDGEPVNMMAFAHPLYDAFGYEFPERNIPFRPLRILLALWQFLHFNLRLPAPPLTPLAIERIGIDNYFSIQKASRDLGYTPLYTTAQGMRECLPYYRQLHDELQADVEAGVAVHATF